MKHRLFALLVLFMAAASAGAQTPAPQFTIKDEQARTGSKFRSEIIKSAVVPLNLPYDRFTEEQKASLKSIYESMGPNDEPPFPAAGLGAIVKELQGAAEILQVFGELELHVGVDAAGKVTRVGVARSIERRLDAYMAGVLVRTPFKPARCDGVPCSQDFLFAWSVVRADR